jgi:hypothetical protein
MSISYIDGLIIPIEKEVREGSVAMRYRIDARLDGPNNPSDTQQRTSEITRSNLTDGETWTEFRWGEARHIDIIAGYASQLSTRESHPSSRV